MNGIKEKVVSYQHGDKSFNLPLTRLSFPLVSLVVVWIRETREDVEYIRFWFPPW